MGTNVNKYIINRFQGIIPYDENRVYIKTCSNTYKIEGASIALLITDLVKVFQTPCSIDDAIDKLSSKYKEVTIKGLIDYLKETFCLINYEDEVISSKTNHKIDMELGFFSSLNGQAKSVLSRCKDVTIGLISSDTFVKSIINNIDDCKLFENIELVNIDNSKYEINSENINVNNVKLTDNIDKAIENVVNKSTFIIVALDRYNDLILDKVNTLCLEREIPWCKVLVNGIIGEIGPIVVPHRTGCYECYKKRLISNYTDDNLIVFNKLNSETQTQKAAYLAPYINIISSLTVLEIMKYLNNIFTPIVGEELDINCVTAESSFHNIVKVDNCPACSNY